MIIVVYLDLYFLWNLFMDFVILLLTGRLMKLTYRLWRLVLGSIIGALGACMILMTRQLPFLVELLFAYVILIVTMVLISFGRYKLNRVLVITLAVYGQTVFLGGLLQFLVGIPLVRKYLNILLQEDSKNRVSIIAMFFIVLFILLLSPYVLRRVNEFRHRLLTVFQVSLSLEGKTATVKGLLDTGNHLREPISNKPVIIVEQRVMDEIMTKDLLEYETRVKLVPYRSIGKESGTLCGIVLDELLIEINEEKHIHKNVIACLYKGTLSKKQDYQVILHEELT